MKYFFIFLTIITRYGNLIPSVFLGSAGHVMYVVLTFVPTISNTKLWISGSVILLMCPFLTFLSQICSGLLPMLYKMDKNPDWKVFLNILPPDNLMSQRKYVVRIFRQFLVLMGWKPWVYLPSFRFKLSFGMSSVLHKVFVERPLYVSRCFDFEFIDINKQHFCLFYFILFAILFKKMPKIQFQLQSDHYLVY